MNWPSSVQWFGIKQYAPGPGHDRAVALEGQAVVPAGGHGEDVAQAGRHRGLPA